MKMKIVKSLKLERNR